MYRGTTPTLILRLPIPTSEIAEAYITFNQSNRNLIEKPLSICSCEGEQITLKLTQEETLRLDSRIKVNCQIRGNFINGDTFVTTIKTLTVNDILKEGVI